MIHQRDQLLAVILSAACGLFFFPGPEGCRAQSDFQGWHTRGQTFLVWEHNAPGDTLYDIYASDEPIGSLSGAQWIGRCFSDNGANFRLDGYAPDARWILPSGSGGTMEVAAEETYFVVTPHEAGQRYYAVLIKADTLVTAANRIGPRARILGGWPVIWPAWTTAGAPAIRYLSRMAWSTRSGMVTSTSTTVSRLTIPATRPP